MAANARDDRWSLSEDQVMQSAVMKYGTNQWSRVASLLSRKNAVQCRTRWFEYLDPRISKRDWSKTEDDKLLQLQNSMPNMWRSIGASLGGRTGQQCYDRWNELQSAAKLQAGSEKEQSTHDSEEDIIDDAYERQLVSEAHARLANSLGRKAKRKKRERLEADRAFVESVKTYRETGKSIISKKGNTTFSIPEIEPPNASLNTISGYNPKTLAKPNVAFSKDSQQARSERNQYQPRRPNRPKLVLPSPQAVKEDSIDSRPRFHVELTDRVLKLLKKIPDPVAFTLVDLYIPSEEKRPDMVPLEHRSDNMDDRESSSFCETKGLNASSDDGPISDEARKLLQDELEKEPPIEDVTPMRHRLSEDIISALAYRESLFAKLRNLREAG